MIPVAFLMWISGLPGSGKSTIARELVSLLEADGVAVEYLPLDAFRKVMVPDPSYDEKERDMVYRALGHMAHLLHRNGVNVIVDATAHKRIWRDLLRDRAPDMIEIEVRCPVELCMKRESEREGGLVLAELYQKALERKAGKAEYEGLGVVPGIDEPYEGHPDAVVLDSSERSPAENATEILALLKDPGRI